MISRFKALIFDMDGTLLDSMPLWRRQNLAYLERNGLPVPEEIKGRELFVTSYYCADLFVEKYGLAVTPQQIVREYEDNMALAYRAGVPQKPGALAFLRAAREKGYRMCVLTLTPQANAQTALETLGVADCFDFILSAETLQMDKRAPETFARVAAMLDTDARDCLVFEDALYAMRAAKKAGCCVYAIEESTAAPDLPEIMGACDRYFEDYNQLLGEL